MEEVLKLKFLEWVREDVPYWDESTEALVPEGVKVVAEVVAGEDGVAACFNDLRGVLESLGIEVRYSVRDGEFFKVGEKVAVLVGDARKLLAVERTLLNLLSLCSGVATEVRKLVDLVRKVNPKVRVAATRKTLPGLRYFQKKALVAGGGDTHRLSLSDSVIIKDNHLRLVGNIPEAVRRVRGRVSFTRKVEVEVSSPEEAVKAAEVGADVVMLDNFTPEEVERTLKLLEERGLRDKVVVEVSGRIREENVVDYARLGVDVISCGYITHSVKAVDLSLEFVEVVRG